MRQRNKYNQLKSAKVSINPGKRNENTGVITAKTVAKTLCCLVDAGADGVTALEISSWAFRLGAYIHILREDYGLDIEMVREDHEGGWHGRYILHTPVTILEAKF